MTRKIPLPSVIIIKFMNVIYTLAYLVVKPMGLAPAFMAFLSGGIFGLFLLPISVLYGLQYVLRTYCLPEEGPWHDAVVYSLWSFVAWYLVTIILDDTHCRVEDACFRTPENVFDRISFRFFLEIFRYFPVTCVPYSDKAKQMLSNPNKQYVIGVHPHGIHCFHIALLSSPETPFDHQFPGLVSGSVAVKHPLTGLCATIMFKIPVVREFFLVFGYVDARRSVASAALTAGKSIYVCIGGEEESMFSSKTRQQHQREDVLVLKHRKGFVRLALSHGADLVPIFGVGNNDTFERYDFAFCVRRWIQKTFKIALPIFHGRYLTPMPYPQPIQAIIGEPIQVPQPKSPGEKPDEALVDDYHQKYIDAVKTIHAKFADRPLRIV